MAARARAASVPNCTSVADKWIDNPHLFSIVSWVSRGVCVRSDSVGDICYRAFQSSLDHLDDTRKAEYAGAASVLALLPTIGALLGAPTTEIWRLLTVIPFGGVLAMTLSFGGAILPVRVEEYENDANGHKATIGRSVTSKASAFERLEGPQDEEGTGPNQVVKKILARIRQDESQRLAKGHLWVGLLVMIVLSIGVQAAMIVIEQGAIIVWWCTSRWWMRFWYFLVTATAIAENRAQLPFSESWKLYVSDIPYDVSIREGNSILPKLENPAASAKQVLYQLASLRAGTVTLHGSKQYTRPRNTVLVMISVANHGQDRAKSLLRLGSKCLSITVFVVGTAIFASAQLLALPVAVTVLTLVLAAGVFARAITGWIVSGISKTEPLIHVIVDTTQEAQRIIARILSVDKYGDQITGEANVLKIQVELGGHVFVNQRRVASRSAWYLRVLGVLAEPFDLRKVDYAKVLPNAMQGSTDHNEFELGLLRE